MFQICKILVEEESNLPSIEIIVDINEGIAVCCLLTLNFPTGMIELCLYSTFKRHDRNKKPEGKRIRHTTLNYIQSFTI
jgi:hypothetical protein